jgi:MFS family permease
VLDRNRGAAYASVTIAGAGMFGIFLFVTYYLETTLKFTPINTGLSFLPMIGMLVLAAQLSTNIFVPRFGPKIMVPFGMLLGATGMIILTRLQVDSHYAANVLPALMILGFGMGSIMPASIQTATLGVDRGHAGVASAMVNTSQQVGGSIGTALLNTLAASAATAYVTAHIATATTAAGKASVAVEAAVHSYSVAYTFGAAFFAFGAILAALLFRTKRDTQARAAAATARAQHEGAAESLPAEPVVAH